MTAAKKLDLFKERKSEYAAKAQPGLVETGPARYLAIVGRGAPGGDEFADKVGALYAVAFTVKMTWKADGRGDYAVCKLEGQWWVDGAPGDWADVPREEWRWRLMIRTPDFIGRAEIDRAVAALLSKKKPEVVREVELFDLDEGPCVQMLHVGPYDEEPASIAKLHAFAAEQGRELRGLHHEIYLSDARRVAPEKLRTILRMPVA